MNNNIISIANMFDISNQEEKKIIGECFKAAAEGPFFPEEEFHTLIGLSREEIKKISDSWEAVDISDPKIQLAINNVVNNLIGYPHKIQGEEWSKYLSISEEQLLTLFKKTKKNIGKNYFENIQ